MYTSSSKNDCSQKRGTPGRAITLRIWTEGKFVSLLGSSRVGMYCWPHMSLADFGMLMNLFIASSMLCNFVFARKI